MKNKFGLGLLITVIIAIIITSSICIVFSIFNNDIYAADEYDEEFSFGILDDKQKQFTGSDNAFILSNQYTFDDMILPEGASYNDVVISEEDNRGLLSINGNVVTAIKIGTNGKIKATLNYNGKTYEAITRYEVMDTDFRFPLESKMQKSFTGKNAFVIGRKTPYEIKMQLPDSIESTDVTFYEKDTNLLEINNQQITAKSEGKGVLIAQITVSGEKKEVSTEFEVINSTTTNNNNTNSQTNKGTKNVSTTKVTKKEEVTLIFKNDVKNVASTSNSVTNKLTKTGVDDINDLTWTSSDPSIATVENKNGKIKIQGKVGTSTITVTHADSGVSASYTINSYQKTLDVINTSNKSKINDEKISINVGENIDFDVQDVNNSISQEDVKWTSSNEKICTVDENGKITPITKGKAKIKAKLESNPQSSASFSVVISSSEEEKMFNDTFSFEIDPDTNKAMKYTGKNALVINEDYVFKMIKPEGAENYAVEYSCNKDGLLDISGEYIKALRVGSGNLIATITIGDKKKTTRTKIQVVATKEEKETATNDIEIPYIYVNLDSNKLNVEKGKKFTLNSNLETNMHSSEYTIEWEATNNDIVKFETNGKKTVSITPVGIGTTDITVIAKAIEGNKKSTISSSTVSIEVKDKVTLVKSIKFDTSDITKSSNKCQLAVGDVYFIPVTVLPKDATEPGYKLELINDDEENFMIRDDNAIIALVPGKTATLRATALDKSNKSVRISLESIDSKESVASLQSLSELNQITVGVGEKQVYRLQNNNDTTVKSNSNIELDENVDTVTIQGREEGTSTITLQSGNATKDIPVAVLQSVDDTNSVAPTKLTFAKDPETGKTKDYVSKFPLTVGWDYDFVLNAEPYGASNEVELFLDNNVDFKVVNNGTQIRPINPRATATLTAVSKYDSSVKANIKIASVATKIKAIDFAREYTSDENAFNINKNTAYVCNLKIKLRDGTEYDPITMDVSENKDYLELLDDIEIYTDDDDVLKVISNTIYPISGINGTGTLKARVKSDHSIKASTKFKSIGISQNINVVDVEFAKSKYNITNSSSTVMKPIITLSNGNVLDPSKTSKKDLSNTPEYKNYIKSVELVNMDGNNGNIHPTKDIVRINNDDFSITPKANGMCELGIRIQGSKEIVTTTILNVNVDFNSSTNPNTQQNGNSKFRPVPVEDKTTTNDKSLRISKVQFASKTYNMTPSYPYIFNPEITLEDGTKLTHESQNKEVYLYYCDQLEIFVLGQTPGIVDLAYAHIDNTALPRTMIGEMPGQIMIGIGKKGEVSVLDTAIINLAY